MSHYLAGVGKQEIVFEGSGFGLMGYGRTTNIIEGRSTSLYSRAFCFGCEDGQQPLFFAQAEICMVFPELKRAVLQGLQQQHGITLDEARLMLVSQHTHSGPGGYSHFPFYNFSIPGFRPAIFEAIVASLVAALEQAWTSRQPAVLQFSSGDFPADADVAFNRSLAAYNRNPGVTPRRDHQTHLAIERTMWLLKAETPRGKMIGQINWFGVHPTSIGSTVNLVSSDNKGYAAEYLEQRMGPGTVAIFAQQFAGDVSPNNQGRTKRGWTRGRYWDEIQSAQFNGQLQCEQAWNILSTLDDEARIEVGALDAALVHRDLSAVEVAADFTGGKQGERTASPCHGLAFFAGSPVDGPAAPKPVLVLLRVLAAISRRLDLRRAKRAGAEMLAEVEAKYRAHAPKVIVTESARGVVLGLTSVRKLPGLLDPFLAEMKREEQAGALSEKPWVPVVLPLQVMRIGELALIGFPGEITTVAGQQLRSLCLEMLAPSGVCQVLISSYANSYFGYCTTWHEYQEQQYEGGHTPFGSRTHDAFRTEYRNLLEEFLKAADERVLWSEPEHAFSAETLALRSVA